MRDIEQDPDAEGMYECFECGTIFTAEDNLGVCPNCDGEIRNRRMPIE